MRVLTRSIRPVGSRVTVRELAPVMTNLMFLTPLPITRPMVPPLLLLILTIPTIVPVVGVLTKPNTAFTSCVAAAAPCRRSFAVFVPA